MTSTADIPQHMVRSLRLALESVAGTQLRSWDRFQYELELVHARPEEELPLNRGSETMAYYPFSGLYRARAVVKGHLSTIFFAEAGDIIAPLMSVGSHQITALANRGMAPRAEALLPAYHRYNVSCIEEGDLLRSPLDLIIELAAEDTSWASLATNIAIMRAMTLQFDCVWLRLSAIERFRVLQLRNPGLVRRITQRELAAYLNVNEATLSRLIKRTREEAASGPGTH